MSPHPLVLPPSQGQATPGPPPVAPALAELAFLGLHGVPAETLRAAAELARAAGVPPVDALLRHGFLDERAFYRALAAELGLPFAARPRAGEGARFPESVRAGLVPLDETCAPHRFAIAPAGAMVRALLARRGAIAPGLAVTTPTLLRRAVMTRCAEAIAREAAHGLPRRRPEASARDGASGAQIGTALALAGALPAAVAAAPATTLACLGATVGLTVLGAIAIRLDALRVRAPVAPRRPPPRRPDATLPVYTVVVPLYREAGVLDRLLRALGALDYPAPKLDIKLVVEADDPETLPALRARDLPAGLEVIVAPPGAPRTKPRALNVALPLARGEFLVVYDAEDVPDPDQLRLAVDLFARAGPEVGCLQARLVIDNTEDGWLPRLFTIEYAALFDVINPGLAAAGLPVPLGGTSMHLRTDVLRAAGGWDAWNVTEDADLGIRLALQGVRVMDLPSSTLEEAPARLGPWMAQRTRWMKGFMQTCITHSRHPGRAARRLGPVGFAAAVAVTFGTVLSALLYPILAPLAVVALVGGALDRIGPAIDALGWGIGLVTLVAGAAAMLLPPLEALRRRRWWRLMPFVAHLPVYYGLVSVAAWRALLELVREPFRWNKTEHGLARTSRAGLARPGYGLAIGMPPSAPSRCDSLRSHSPGLGNSSQEKGVPPLIAR
ncbi:MAG TPA: glycosyltransferase [Salinarimonas sp.]|nr:glycosyltransferase [Salinarimonas sp.]